MNDKELLKLIKSRRSTRKLMNICVKEEDLRDLVEAGIYAPTGSNTQCYRFIITTNKEDIDFLAKNKLRMINRAPAVIIVIADKSSCPYLKSNRKEEFDKLPYQDCAMAMQNICLLAETKGLSTCVIHLSEKIKNANLIADRFGLNFNYELMGVIMIGYASEKVDYETTTHAGKSIKRKPITKYILKWNK